MMSLNAEHNPVALGEEISHWTKGYLGNQHRWDELLNDQFSGAQLIKWGLNKRVYLLDGRIIKVSFVESGESDAERHCLRTEFEMNEVCEGKLWELRPAFHEKAGEWEMLQMDHLPGHTLNQLIELNQAGKIRLFSLIHALFYLSLKGLSYKQLRGRHIFLRSDGHPVLIDFGGSQWSTRREAFWNNLAPIKKEKGEWHISRFGYIATCILRQSFQRSPKYSDSGKVAPSKRSFESNDETFVRLQLGKNREDLKREPVKGDLSSSKLFRAWKQSVVDLAEAFPEKICDVFRWEFNEGAVIWGGDSWGVIWDEISRKIKFQGKRVLEQGGSLGLGPVHARLAGAQSVVSFIDNDASKRAGENAVSFFGVDQVYFELPSGKKFTGIANGDIGLALSITANESNWEAVKKTLSACALVVRRTRGGLDFIEQS